MIIRLTQKLFIVFFVGFFATSVMAEELRADMKGSGSGLTDEFEIQGPWLLDYSVTSEYPNATGIEITLVDAVFLDHKGVVLKARFPTGGTRLFHDSGRFRFRITATIADWRLRVSKISREEAEAMIPTRPGR